MKSKLAVLITLMCVSSAFSDSLVRFETNKSEVPNSELARLKETADHIINDKAVVVLIGHADKRGSRLYNLDLGNKRAESVKAMLQKMGVSSDQLIVSVSYGKDKPLAPNDDTADHLATNRRVEIIPVKALTGKEVVKEKVVLKEVTKTEYVEKLVYGKYKNRISLLGGLGPIGLDKNTWSSTRYSVTREYGAVFGAGYARNLPWLNGRVSLGVSVFSNNGFFGSAGYDF